VGSEKLFTLALRYPSEHVFEHTSSALARRCWEAIPASQTCSAHTKRWSPGPTGTRQLNLPRGATPRASCTKHAARSDRTTFALKKPSDTSVLARIPRPIGCEPATRTSPDSWGDLPGWGAGTCGVGGAAGGSRALHLGGRRGPLPVSPGPFPRANVQFFWAVRSFRSPRLCHIAADTSSLSGTGRHPPVLSLHRGKARKYMPMHSRPRHSDPDHVWKRNLCLHSGLRSPERLQAKCTGPSTAAEFPRTSLRCNGRCSIRRDRRMIERSVLRPEQDTKELPCGGPAT